MTKASRRIGLGIGAAAIAAVMAGASYQNISAQAGTTGGPGVGRFGGAGRGVGGPGGGPGGPMGRRGGPGGPGGILGPMMIERLDLTSDQRDRVRQIVESHRTEQQALADRGMKAHEALQEVVTGTTFDESAIRARAADVAVVDADMAVAQARVFGEVVQILTSDQQEKLKQLQAAMKQRAEKMREQRTERRGQKK